MRKYGVSLALFGILGFISACGPNPPIAFKRVEPTPTPTPEARIRCDYVGKFGKHCIRDGETYLLFRVDPYLEKYEDHNIPLGMEAKITVFFSSEIFHRNYVDIQYTKGTGWYPKEKRGVFASVPTNRRIEIPFKPDTSGCFIFYVTGVDTEKLEGQAAPKKEDWQITHINVGRPTPISLKVDPQETTTYKPVKIKVNIPYYAYGQIVLPNNRWVEMKSSEEEIIWIPESPGIYEIKVGGLSHPFCEYLFTWESAEVIVSK
ncbi:MAG: hypothetical protein QXP82_02565 [Candidatus Aenigmatarchaeota archaeon]